MAHDGGKFFFARCWVFYLLYFCAKSGETFVVDTVVTLVKLSGIIQDFFLVRPPHLLLRQGRNSLQVAEISQATKVPRENILPT